MAKLCNAGTPALDPRWQWPGAGHRDQGFANQSHSWVAAGGTRPLKIGQQPGAATLLTESAADDQTRAHQYRGNTCTRSLPWRWFVPATRAGSATEPERVTNHRTTLVQRRGVLRGPRQYGGRKNRNANTEGVFLQGERSVVQRRTSFGPCTPSRNIIPGTSRSSSAKSSAPREGCSTGSTLSRPRHSTAQRSSKVVSCGSLCTGGAMQRYSPRYPPLAQIPAPSPDPGRAGRAAEDPDSAPCPANAPDRQSR